MPSSGLDFSEASTLCMSTNCGATWTKPFQAQGLKFTALATVASSPSVPTLTIARSGNSDVVSWPVAFTNYTLQSTPTLNAANWQNVAQLNNGNNVITNPISGAQGFYRLVGTNNSSSLPTVYLGTDTTSGQGVLKARMADISGYTRICRRHRQCRGRQSCKLRHVFAGLNGGNDRVYFRVGRHLASFILPPTWAAAARMKAMLLC